MQCRRPFYRSHTLLTKAGARKKKAQEVGGLVSGDFSGFRVISQVGREGSLAWGPTTLGKLKDPPSNLSQLVFSKPGGWGRSGLLVSVLRAVGCVRMGSWRDGVRSILKYCP